MISISQKIRLLKTVFVILPITVNYINICNAEISTCGHQPPPVAHVCNSWAMFDMSTTPYPYVSTGE